MSLINWHTLEFILGFAQFQQNDQIKLQVREKMSKHEQKTKIFLVLKFLENSDVMERFTVWPCLIEAENQGCLIFMKFSPLGLLIMISD